jgi:hypothetical protein
MDWDVRLRSQLADFALGVQILSQPLSGSGYADPTFPTPIDDSQPVELDLSWISRIQRSTDSPYGWNWDVLWLGHCGANFPSAEHTPKASRGRVVIHNDPTVPQTQYYDIGWGSDELLIQYPNHTRVIHHTADNVCNLAYAVTQKAARQILYQTGVKLFNAPMDIMLRQYCDGQEDRKIRNCFTAQPAYFEHFRPKGDMSHFSDTSENNHTMNEEDFTKNIRVSTKVNLEKLTEGDAMLIDQYPDV